jgi:opacity protein-like surface antigen
MKRAIPVLLVVALALCSGTAMAEFKGDVNLWLGMKKFSDDYKFEEDFLDSKQPSSISIDLTSQQEYGLMANFGGVDWPVAIAVDILNASDDDTWSYSAEYGGYDYTYSITFDTSTMELGVGVRKFFLPDGKLQPYIGGGLDYFKADAELRFRLVGEPIPKQGIDESFKLDDSASTVGFFLNAGVAWRIGKMLNLGADLRYSNGSVDYEFEDPFVAKQEVVTESADVGGYHFGVFLGIRF